jgi:hypothetical protein
LIPINIKKRPISAVYTDGILVATKLPILVAVSSYINSISEVENGGL